MRWALLLLVSCPKKASPPPEDLAEHMQGHFDMATAIRNAVIAGNLPLAKRAGTLLAQHSDDSLPESWQPSVARMKEAATDAKDAPDLQAAGAAAARLGRACGSCHAALGQGPEFVFDAAPIEGKPVLSRMLRHQWAAERMWEGLITPEPQLFAVGARTISGAPIWEEEALPQDIAEMEPQVRELGQQAVAASSDSARVEAYGRLLATCAGCHASARP